MRLLIKITRLFFFFILLLTALPVAAQNKDEKLAEQKKLEQKITESNTVSGKIENAGKLATFYIRYKNKQAEDSIIKLIFEWATASGAKQDMFAAYRWTAIAYLNYDFEKWKNYIQQGLDFAVKERLPNEEALMYCFLGRKYGQLREFDKANEYYSRVDLNKDGIEDTTRYNYFYRKSEMFFIQKKILEGIKNLFAAKKYAERSKVTKYIAEVNHHLGKNFDQIKEYEKAITYYQVSKKEYEKIDDINSVLRQEGYTASAYRSMKKYPIAEGLLENMIRKADSVAFYEAKYVAVVELWGIYYDQGELIKGAAIGKKYKLAEYFSRIGDSAFLYNINAIYAEIESRYDSADHYYRKAIAYTYRSSNKLGVARNAYTYADYLKRYKRYTEALPQMKLSLTMYDSIHEVPALPDVYNNLDSIYTALGDYKNAWQARGNYYVYRDSIENQNRKEDILREELAAEEESMKKAAEEEIKAQKENIIFSTPLL